MQENEKKNKIFMVINCCEIICKKRPAKANIKKKKKTSSDDNQKVKTTCST